MNEEVLVAGYWWHHHQGVTTCRHVFDGEPVRFFAFASDQDLEFMCGEEVHFDRSTEVLAGLCHLLERHQEINSLPEMVPGQWAERPDEESEWIVGLLDADTHNEGLNP